MRILWPALAVCFSMAIVRADLIELTINVHVDSRYYRDGGRDIPDPNFVPIDGMVSALFDDSLVLAQDEPYFQGGSFPQPVIQSFITPLLTYGPFAGWTQFVDYFDFYSQGYNSFLRQQTSSSFSFVRENTLDDGSGGFCGYEVFVVGPSLSVFYPHLTGQNALTYFDIIEAEQDPITF